MAGTMLAEKLQQEVFFNRDETFQGSITNRKAFIAISNKRLYTSFKTWGTKREQSVDLRDVTGVSYLYVSPIAVLIAAILVAVATVIAAVRFRFMDFILPYLAIGGVLFLILLLVFLLGRRTILQVEFAGGKINYLVRGSSANEVRDFISRVRWFKDCLVEDRPVQ